MRRKPEVEDMLKSAIRDQLALYPLMSVQKMRIALQHRGYFSIYSGTLDWHYISKLIQKVRTENLIKLGSENRTARLVALKERHRALSEQLIPIVEGDLIKTPLGASYPTQRDRISAANVILKWDMALFFAEEQINSLDKTQTIEKKRTRAVIMTDTISETRILTQPKSANLLKRRIKIPQRSEQPTGSSLPIGVRQ